MELQPAVTVVIPMLNASGHIATLLDSLWAQDFEGPWEIIAVDNGSVDGTAQLTRELLEAPPPKNLLRGEVILVPSPQGYATPRNAGARHSRAPLLAFCDADGAVDEGWLTAIVRALGDHPLVASAKIYVTDVSKRHSVDPGNDALRLPSLRGIDFVTTAGMGCSSELFALLGGFDTHFDCGGEDPDFSLRARSQFGTEPFLASDAAYWSSIPKHLRTRFTKGLRDGRAEVRLYVRHRESVLREPSGPLTTLIDMSVIVWRVLAYPWRRGRSESILREAGCTIGRAIWSIRLGVRCF
ncbi:MAG: glycosyltransferase family 2 protein [Acidimicrobiia bacterium]